MKLGRTARWLLQTMYSGGLNSFATMEIPPEAQPSLGSKTTFVAQQSRSSHHASKVLNKKFLLILQMQTSSFFLWRFDEISGGGKHLCIGRFHKESIIGTFHLTSLMSVVLELKDI